MLVKPCASGTLQIGRAELSQSDTICISSLTLAHTQPLLLSSTRISPPDCFTSLAVSQKLNLCNQLKDEDERDSFFFANRLQIQMRVKGGCETAFVCLADDAETHTTCASGNNLAHLLVAKNETRPLAATSW